MTATLIPQAKQQYTDNSGNLLSGGKLYTWAAGTSTNKTTWSDAAQTTPNPNPVILDSRGEAVIYWSGNYKVELRSSTNVLIWTQDNVAGASLSNALTINNGGAGAASGSTFDGSAAVTLSYNSIGAAPLASPALTGTPTAPTATLGTNTTQLATCAFVTTNFAPIASPTFTGTPAAPTAAAGTNTTQLATTAFVTAADAASKPAITTVSAGFTAVDADNNTHKVASGVAQTLTLGSITAGVSFTLRFTTAWSIACAGGLSKNGASPTAITTGSIAANSLITFLHEGSGVWSAVGSGLT